MTSTINGGRMFHFQNQSGSATISGNTNGSVSITLPTISGYTPVGIMAIQNSHGANFCITDYRITSGTEARVVMRNLASTAATITVTVKVLYVRSNLTN